MFLQPYNLEVFYEREAIREIYISDHLAFSFSKSTMEIPEQCVKPIKS